MDSSTRPELPQPLRAPNIVSNQAMGRLCGLLTSDLEEPASASIPALLGRYRIIRPLAEGASGKVYEAEDLQLGRRVAMKVLGADADSMVKRFFREASVAAKLRHPNLITIHEVSMARRGDGSPVHFIVMDLHPRTLEAVLERNELTRDERLKLLEAVARAVHHAHENGVVHRDLKPANILIDERGNPVVSDFGLAREESQATLTRSGVPVGTPSYMSPEQVAGRAALIGPRSDVYALGVILYRMLTNRLPFDGTSVAEVYSSILAEDPKPPEAGRDLQTICLKAMDRERDRRYATALDFAEDVRRFLAGEPILARPDRTIRRIRRAARNPLFWAAAAVVALSIGAAWALQRQAATATKAQSADDAAQMNAAFLDIQLQTADPMRYLEDAFYEGNDGSQANAHLERIERVATDVGARHPMSRCARAWVALARVFAGRDGALGDLDAAAREAGTDPFPWLLLGRARLACYVQLAHVEAAFHPDTRTLDLGSFRESEEMAEQRRLARAAFAHAASTPHWAQLTGLADYIAILKLTTLLGNGEFEKAANELLALYRSPLLRVEAASLRAICLSRTRQYAAAAEAWESASDRRWYPVFVLACLARRESAETSADPVRSLLLAIDRAGEAERVKPGDILPPLLAFWAWWDMAGRSRDAVEAFGRALDAADRAIRVDRDCSIAWNAKAAVHLELAKRDHAARRDPRPRLQACAASLTESLRANPGDRGAVEYAVELYTYSADIAPALDADPAPSLTEALKYANVFVEGAPAEPRAWFALGNVRQALGELEAAIDAYSRALQLKPEYGPAFGNRAESWRRLGDRRAGQGSDPLDAYEHALADFNDALRLETEPVESLNQRGVVKLAMAEWLHDHGKDAAPCFRQALDEHAAALKLDPKNARAAYLKGIAQRTIGDHNPDEAHRRKHYEAAMKEFADAVGRNPAFVEAWLAHGEILDKFGRAVDAVDHYEAALKAVPDHGELRERLAAARERMPK